ncbi:hypothetical protein F5883DRAFT_434467 [Diaporthe sp. PMI_573]|nr:hypothetical protein F5883DRAFT_434467 [Diaporthaceae sp. PMI_573]
MWSKLNELQLGSTEADISAILRSHGPEELDGLVDRVVQTYTFTSRYTENPELRNHVLFLQHAQNYLLLKYAVKHADLGLLRRAIARSCVYFHASGQHKYAYEMLYLQRLISTDAAAPELQRAILANGLVNPTGVHDSWYETDRLVEFHNGTLKTIFNDRRGSSVTVKYLMENCALNTEFFKAIAEDMESFLFIKQNGVHAEKPAIIDLRLMARALAKGGSITGTQRHVVTHDAVDLFDAAIPKLAGEALCKFNKKESTDPLDLSANDFDTEEDEVVDEVDDFFTIEASDET